MPTLYIRKTGKTSWRYYLNWIDTKTEERYREAIPWPSGYTEVEYKKHADQQLADLTYKLQTDQLTYRSGITLGELICRYIEHAKSRKTQRGLVRDSHIFRALLKHFNPDMPAEEINLSELDKYVTARKGSGVASSTVNRELNTIKRMFAWATEHEIISENRIVRYKHLPVPDNSRKDFTRDQVALILGSIPQTEEGINFARFLLFILYTGFRIEKLTPRDPLSSETPPLKWNEVDLDLAIIKTVNPKTRRALLVPLADDIKEILLTLKDATKPNPEDSVFPWTYNASQQRWNRLRAKLIKADHSEFKRHTLNSWRHTFATFSSMAGDQLATSRIMGHSSLATTRIYMATPVEQLRKAVSGLDLLDFLKDCTKLDKLVR